ncbi:MAG: hypothetical protein HGB23_00760 [Chlorobiaceae bacterium]|nr:hypothetical protein [Chlorobiaceae bacterium]
MLKFILFVILFYLIVRMVWRLFRRGLFFHYSSRNRENSPGVSASRKQIEESDYEVIESHLSDNERDVS